jgi:uncharacterized protein (DUF1778 family)
MARPPTEEGDIKIVPEVHEKRAFIKAATAARQSLNQWMIAAAIKAAAEQGFPVEKKGRR